MRSDPRGQDREDEISLYRDEREFIAGLMAEALEEDDHLESEEIADYVAGRLDGIARTCAEGHLECCEMCLREVRELCAWVIKTTPLIELPAQAGVKQRA